METLHRFVGLRRDAKPRAIQYSSIKYRSSANTGVDVSRSRARKEAGTGRCTEAQQRLGELILTQEDFKEQKKGNPTDDSRHLEAAYDALGLAPRAGVRADGASSACREYPVCIPAGTPVYQPAQPDDDSEPYATAALQASASAARRRAAALSALRHGGSGSGGGGEGREQYEAVWEG